MNEPSFDITTTSTLQAVATADERALVDDLQHRVEESIREAEQQPEVVASIEEYRQTEAAVRKLQTAARVLNETARELREQVANSRSRTLDKLIDSAAVTGKTDYTHSGQLATLEHREKLTGRAMERLVEHLTPLAQIARLRAEAHALLVRGKSIERAAQQRAERILDQLRDAVSDEIVLPVDLSKGVAGALLARAAGLKRLAIEASTNADQLEKWYMDRNRKD